MLTAVLGGLLLAMAAVGLVPMIREALAVRGVRARLTVERMDPVGHEAGGVTYRCGGRPVVLSDGPPPGAPSGPTGRVVRIQLGDTAIAATDVSINLEAEGANRYWNRVVPFRWVEASTGRQGCGVAWRLPVDTVAVRRVREERKATGPAWVLRELGGARPPHLHGARFRTIRWEEGVAGIREEDFDYADWSGDPYGTLVINLLGSPVGVGNQSLSYWPTLFFPVLYPLGLAVLGLVLVGVGLVGRWRAGRVRQ